ncbi:Inositol polyphosphate 5-phosphatase [Echinococcus granulosus]|uniref:Inositol polyphosphate 5-phosphatase n=1 Tax=Echinococcus granulosus TaxID=6210 RepID=W6UPG4_ECHGR|nr:Inositol polyphosphate 5-phosphatase [Echinococcus granulosus]EUB55309.1 Inositol polyphosphate 5-phosphatase [Echinococcus granulosus]
MGKNGEDFALVIQEFIDVKARQDGVSRECNEKCLVAFEVSVVQSWVDVPRIVALIRNEENKQAVLFVFAGTRIADTVVSYLTTDKLIAVDRVFSCESDSTKPTMLRVIGRDISSFRSDSVLLGSTLPSKNRTLSVSQKCQTTTFSTGLPIIRKKTRFSTLILGFDDATSANQFRTELNLELSNQADSLPLAASSTNWLDKYRADIATPSHTPSLSHLNRPLRTARSFADIAHDGTSTVPTPFSSTSCSSTSSESLKDVEDGKIGPISNEEAVEHVRRTVSVPYLLEEEEIEKGQDAITALADSNWISGDCSTTELNAPLPTVTMTANARQDIEDLPRTSVVEPAEATRAEQNGRRISRISFMSDSMFRARMSADPIVRSKLEEDEAVYCTWKTLNLFIGSWNVNGRQDSLLRLDAWIRPPPGCPPADIYVFGFQELDLNLAGMALNKQTASPFESKWLWLLEASMEDLLNPSSVRSVTLRRWVRRSGGGFKRLSIVRLAGLLLVVYVSNRLSQQAIISAIAVQSVPTGMFNLMGNKGAVGLRLTVYNHSLCFLNCHLAAGPASCERRNQDYGEIMRKMMFERRSLQESPQYLLVNDHDQVFLFGDLNYRLTGLDVNENLAAIARKDFDLLVKFDELSQQKAQRRVLQDFSEGKIAFPPTYKFDLTSDSYCITSWWTFFFRFSHLEILPNKYPTLSPSDLISFSREGRVPSYCDRILWQGKFVDLLRYQSHEDFRLSDHKPVSAYFKIGARCVNQQLFMRAYEAVIRSQDLFYNMLLPQAALSSQEVDFGPVQFEDIRTQTIRLTNTGHSGLEFTFTQEGPAAFPPWLHVAPLNHRVEKGESCDISLDVCVSPDVVATVQSSISLLSCIIVLTLVGGKDFFVSITGRFVPTSFGLPLTLLLRLPATPVALLPPDHIVQLIRESRVNNWSDGEPSVVISTSGSILAIPKEIYRLTDFIAARFEEPGLFRQPEIRSDLPIIRDTLDTTKHDVPIPSTVSVHSVIYSLLVFLSALPEPVVPFAFQSNCVAAARQATSNNVLPAYQAISRLPIDYQNLFFYLVSFIKRCLSHSEKNGTNVYMLATTFADILLRDPPYAASPPTAPGVRNGPSRNASTRNQQQQMALSRHELKTAFLRIFITSDTEEVIRRLK